MRIDVLRDKIAKAKLDAERHRRNAEWSEAETKECLLIQLENLLADMLSGGNLRVKAK